MLPEGVAPATVVIAGGAIAAVHRGDAPEGPAAGGVVWDVGARAVLPGLVDTHVHVNEPGRTAWEGFRTASLAAASGGVTTFVDMPLNSDPVTTTVGALRAKAAAAAASCRIDYGFWGGLVPDSIGVLEELWEAGALGFKAFLVDSGLADFPPVGRRALERAMPLLARLGAPLLVHAEAPGPIEAATGEVRRRIAARPEVARRHAAWEASRPPAAEAEAIDLLARLAADTGCRVHIVHVSSRDAAARVAAARAAGLPLTAETCPHYLTFDASDIPDGAVLYKCAPPIRGGAHREALWSALGDGVLDLVASDHSPCPPALKADAPDGFFGAWGGIASLGLALPAIWTAGAGRGVSLDDLARWSSAAPARLAGLAERKGAIEIGRDADLAIFDTEADTAVSPESFRCRHPFTPYAGMRMRGRVTHTLRRGRLVWSAPGEATPAGTPAAADPGPGRWLR